LSIAAGANQANGSKFHVSAVKVKTEANPDVQVKTEPGFTSLASFRANATYGKPIPVVKPEPGRSSPLRTT
jgi:hypothetical protein